jgi:hypothetical protein
MADAAPARHPIRQAWDDLVAAGAMRAGVFADLETWLLRRGYGVRHAEDLSAAQAADALAALKSWLDRVRK